MRTLLFFLATVLFLNSPAAYSQTDKALLRDLAEENKKSVEALALYPEDARLAILESSKYPEILVKMKNAQEKTSAAFRTLIEDYPRATQDVFFDLSRYPGLLTNLVASRNDRTAMRKTLDVLPENQRDKAFDIADREMNTVVKITELLRTAQGAFDNMIAGYPAPAQDAFRHLLDLPEVIDILNEDLRFTVMVGDVYKDDPAWVIHKMDSLNLAVAREHADELENWKQSIENDPQAREELQTAAREYADEYGYTDEVYDIVNDDLYYEDNAERSVVERHYYYSYPYWFGYPWWAPEPCWRPYPYWWYWGFYPYYQTVVIVYMPSYHFMHWYFGNPHHHYAYNHLSAHFVNHYYGHRRSGTSISVGVNEWRNRNRTIVSDEWLSDKKRLPERLREYGRFEENREQYNAKNPGRAMTQEQYLEKNTRQYTDLVRSREQAQTEIQREQIDQDRQRSNWAPSREPVQPAPARVPRTDMPEKPKTQPTPPARPPLDKTKPETPPARPPLDKAKPATPPAPRSDRPARQPVQRPKIDEAKEYHRDKWQEPKRTQPQTQPAPKPRTITPAPRKEAPKKTPDTLKKRGG